MFVGLKRISATLGLLAATAMTPALAQDTASSPNQELADAVAAVLRTSKALKGYRLDIETRSGQVTLRGVVATPGQHNEAIHLAQRVPGVAAVLDGVQVGGDARVQPAQYESVPMTRGLFGRRGYAADGSMGGDGMMGTPTVAYNMQPGAAAPAAPTDGPLPEGPAGGMGGGTQTAMPNYAWPSYAPYPNFSAVGYPTVYPWQAWPNIGPLYPYPEVPLDWRAVTLRWDDGLWWLDFKRGYTRPFFTPYPFGIFGY